MGRSEQKVTHTDLKAGPEPGSASNHVVMEMRYAEYLSLAHTQCNKSLSLKIQLYLSFNEDHISQIILLDTIKRQCATDIEQSQSLNECISKRTVGVVAAYTQYNASPNETLLTC